MAQKKRKAPAKKKETSVVETGSQDAFVRTVMDSVADGVFTVDEDFRITSFNRAAERILGMPREQAIGQQCCEVFRADICHEDCALRETLATGRQIIDKPVSILNSKAKRVPISISTAVLKDNRGGLIGGVETFRDLSALELLKKKIDQDYSYEDIISKNHRIQAIFNLLPDIAESDSTILIEGPSGSGKELFARAIHNLSPRKGRPYVVVNCGALPDTLLESELFGYVKGAFTDAKRDKPGRFALAEGGTLFLDEVGDLSFSMQVKLLRVLQEKEYEPLGATRTVKANVRILAATHDDLLDLVREGKFREDLYYRLHVVKIVLPPLRERREDVPLLIDHFLEQFNVRMGKSIAGVSDDVLHCLMEYPFPGNVRELENIIEHACVLCRSRRIEIQHLPPEIREAFERTSERTDDSPDALPVLQSTEIHLIRKTLAKYDGNRLETARELGLHKTTLWRKMKRYGISYP
jgi:PAS domain S-box-containing protein